MMIIELEDLVGNAVCSLYEKKGIKSIDLQTLNRYQNAISNELKQKDIKFSFEMSRDKTNNFKMFNKYFDVYGEQNLNFVLKDGINPEELYYFRGYLPFELLIIILSEPVLKALGIEKNVQKIYTKK
ncbi:MAG: hypothetical protein IJO32_00885 [Bacilli bacterium]|nr:hypothetical protein [Bacilli bacterium]